MKKKIIFQKIYVQKSLGTVHKLRSKGGEIIDFGIRSLWTVPNLTY